MKTFLKTLALAFSAGCLGGLMNSLFVWFFGETGITQALGVTLAPALTPKWLYPRVVWGGIWGFLFIFPILKRSHFMRGILLSLGPTLVQLFYVFPSTAGMGQAGLGLGTLTPAFVLFYNAVWGITASYWLRLVGK
jgi:hypothetical protein